MVDAVLGDRQESYSYPGSFRDYSRQAFAFSAGFGAVLLAVIVVVLCFDRIILGGIRFMPQHFIMLGFLLMMAVIITQLMARSLSRFNITADEEDLTVRQGGSQKIIRYRDISGIDRIRIPGWWPLRPDLKSRRETARTMIRIRIQQGTPTTFISGLVREDELIKRIRQYVGLKEAP